MDDQENEKYLSSTKYQFHNLRMNYDVCSAIKSLYQNPMITKLYTLTLLSLISVLLKSGTSWCYFGMFTHTNDVLEASYSPDGSKIVVASNDNNHYIYNALSFLVEYPLTATTRANTAKYSRDGLYIAIGLQNNSVLIYSSSYTFVAAVPTAFGVVNELHFNKQSTLMLVCGGGGSNGYEIFNVPTWTIAHSDYTYGDSGLSCRFADDSGRYAVGTKDGYIRYYFPSNILILQNQMNSNADVEGLDFSPNGSYLLVAWSGAGRKVGIFDLTSVSPEFNLSGSSSNIFYCTDWSEDGTLFSYAGNSNQVLIKNGSAPAQFDTNIKVYTEPADTVYSVDYSYDSQWLVAGIRNNDILIYKRDCDPKPQNSQQFCPAEKYMDTVNSCRMCARDMTGCRKCTNATVCLACSDQYYLNTGTNLCSLCSSTLTACVLCTDASTCEQCASQYFLSAGQCLDCFTAIDGCLVCNSSSYCFECAANTHYLNSSSGLCVSCPSGFANCLNCNSSQCLRCQPSYFLDSGECSKCSENCSVCATASTTCSACDIGFYLSGSSCLPCVPFCTLCSDATTCISCQQGYFLSGSSCLACNFSCSRCVVSATNCLSCNSGFYLSGTSCLSCSGGCISCTSPSNCLSCGTGNFLSGTFCAHCSTVVSNCLICDGTNCWECAAGFTLANNTCNSCSSLQPGCQICEGSSCVLCLRQYYLSSGSCLSCAYPCLTCYSSTQCLSCPVGYFIDATDVCQLCPCPSCSSLTACLSCAVGQYLDTGSCYTCSAVHSHCLSCQSNIVCTDCAPPFFLSGNNCSRCTLGCSSCNGASCLTCEPGFYISGSSCLSCLNNCSVCTSAAVCTECVPGHYLSNTTCISCSSLFSGCTLCDSLTCLSCDEVSGYYLNNSLCTLCSQAISHCRRCDSYSLCFHCQPSYMLDPSNRSLCVTCLSLIPNCQICTSPTTCVMCTSGSYSSGLSCLPCSRGCYSCTSASACVKCLSEFWLDGTNSCVECGMVMVGCQECSSLAVCTRCAFGYYMGGSGCLPCGNTINGCLNCFNAFTCQACQSGYYLDSADPLQCLTCESSMTGCIFCNSSSTCDSCQSGYYISGLTCSLCSDPNCMTCNTTHCQQCYTGYYIHSSGSCRKCNSKYSGCIMCNSTVCLNCQSGYSLASGVCSQCLDANCQFCDSSDPTKCLHCNSGFYMSTNQCYTCSGAMGNCQTCLSNTVCFNCSFGYYLEVGGAGCGQCSTSMPYCRSCLTPTTCTSCNNGNFLQNNTCHFCSIHLQGCAFCQVSTICLNCLQGYYLNTTTHLCSRCSLIEGCIICRDLYECRYCQDGYYVENGSCWNCTVAMDGCMICQSGSVCTACSGDYTLTGSLCQVVIIYRQYKELSFTSRYVDSTTLSHTLSVKGTTFDETSRDLTLQTSISYITDTGVTAALTIKRFQYTDNRINIVYYTNNPFNFDTTSSDYKGMDLFSLKRRLEQQNGRILAGVSNLNLKVNFQISMGSNTVGAILASSASHGGALQMSYNINSPEFIASTLNLRSYYNHYFGQIIVLFLLVFYFIKGVILDPEGTDKGQLISHLLLLKTPTLAVFPVYSEMINYCRGYMIADLPFLDSAFGQLFADPLDSTPDPYRIFYTSLSISSTYLLALIAIASSAIIIGVVAYLSQNFRPVLRNISLFLFNFFYSGLAFASVLCIQGAFLNLAEQFTINSSFYLLGMLIWFFLLGQALYSVCRQSINIFKFRIIFKTAILSILHYSPLYLVSIVVGCEFFFIYLQLRLSNWKYPQLEVIINLLPDLALLLLVEFSHSLVIIYIASVIVFGTIVLELVKVNLELKMLRLTNALKIGNELHEDQEKVKDNLVVKMKAQDVGLDVSLTNEDRYVIGNISMNEFGVVSNTNDSRQNLYSVNQVVQQFENKSEMMSKQY